MIRLQESLSSPRSAQECFAFVADFRNLPLWDPTADSAVKTTPGAVGIGSVFEIVVMFGPRRLPMRYVITDYEPDRRVVLSGDSETVAAIDEIRFEPLATGTRVVYTADIILKSAGKLTEAAARPIVAFNGKRAIAGLRRALDAEPAIAGPSRWRDLLDRAVLPGALRFTAGGYRAAGLPPVVDRMDGRTVVITGATSGIGEAAAVALSRLGARVVLVGRHAAKLEATRAMLLADNGGDIAMQQADLESMAEVEALGMRLLASEPQIDVLINNAGALFAERAVTVEGHERCLAINLLAPYLLTERLLPKLRACGTALQPSRIVNVSSGGMYLQKLVLDDLENAQGRYDGAKAYARAKRGLVALTIDWARQLADAPVVVHAMHPGWVDTPGIVRSLPGFHRAMKPWLRTPQQGADTIVWLAASPRVATARGNFWLDRQAHLTEVLPGTAVDHAARIRLADKLRSATIAPRLT
jgi:NAD(P)-dependent dehydrogenase (short-subunit alcohol dehydrogenase family)